MSSQDLRRIRDTQDLIDRKRRDQGGHECEVLGPGSDAAESTYAWNTCTKNMGHSSFISACDFGIGHLPERCRDASVLAFVMTICALTVRLRVGHTSQERPDGYSFSKDRGSAVLHVGSGWAYRVRRGAGSCPCRDCVGSVSPAPAWYQIYIQTACHVVFNTEEARSTMVDFFYDDESSRVKGRVMTRWGCEVVDKNVHNDTCKFFLATHDQSFAERLRQYVLQTVHEVFESRRVSFLTQWQCDCIIVSHPHGQPKHLTIGKVKLWPFKSVSSRRSFVYTTDTCPGSSGAPVGILEFLAVAKYCYVPRPLCLLAPHSEWLEQMAINKSGASELRRTDFIDRYSIFQKHFYLDLKEYYDFQKSILWYHECEVLGRRHEAVESAYAWDKCTKNRDHVKFIPVPKFCLEDLPAWCRNKSVLKYVLAICALTVRLRVTYTSWGRPLGYTFSKDRGSDLLHLGSGWVWKVLPGNGFCLCADCFHSPSPHKRWFVIHIQTACHVVYNTEEAQHTKIDFFYDDEAWRNKKSCWAQGIENVDEKSDNCTLLLATHDKSLAERLQLYIKRLQKPVFKTDRSMYLSKWQRDCLVVSHPHGQSKHVTLGKLKLWTNSTLSHRRNFVYTTDTCPGSSGAPVMVFEFMELCDLHCSAGALSMLAPHSEWLAHMGFNLSGWPQAELPDFFYTMVSFQWTYWLDMKDYICHLLLPTPVDLAQYGLGLLWLFSHVDCSYLF